jgi:hypothetical protein
VGYIWALKIYMKIILSFFTVLIAFIACNNNTNVVLHQYTLKQLLNTDSAKLIVTNYDTLTEVKDKVKDSTFFGLYTFDRKGNLRFYAFFEIMIITSILRNMIL